MSQPIIEVAGLSKRYRLGALGARSLREEAEQLWHRLKRGNTGPSASAHDFWALREVSFSVEPGEVVGVIGRNGAGKSTLLKILSRITEPTAGEAVLRGRVASLLEVGTGFHPELSGRENIFLNGAILGMKRAEIARKLDEIVAFAEIERFLDTPVKRYSSGMYVRLAFAVAAHLEPEILIVDEVLAVGDVQFQKKCLGKMREVSTASGRTVLFVSHNMAVVSELCGRAVLLDGGHIVANGRTDEVVRGYFARVSTDSSTAPACKAINREQHDGESGGTERMRLREVRLVENQFPTFTVHWKQPIRMELQFEVMQPLRNVLFSLGVSGLNGGPIFGSHSDDEHGALHDLPCGLFRITVTLANPLRAGQYALAIGADTALGKAPILHVARALCFEVLDVAQDGEAYPQYYGGPVNGNARWTSPLPC
jgi:lipopolysaccharide transport system ATP-binding protein